MWVNEYKQCVLALEDSAVLCWMPVNGARPDAAVELNNDGKLWTVTHVYQEPVLDLATLQAFDDTAYGRYIEGYHGKEMFHDKTDNEVQCDGAVCACGKAGEAGAVCCD